LQSINLPNSENICHYLSGGGAFMKKYNFVFVLILSLCSSVVFADNTTSQYTVKFRGQYVISQSTKTKDIRNYVANGNLAKTGHKIPPRGIGGELATGYFIHDNVSVETSIALNSYKLKSDVVVTNNPAAPVQYTASNIDPHVAKKRSYMIPIVATAQYHPFPEYQVSPYAGFGVHYTIQSTGKIARIKNHGGFVMQAGVDVWDAENIGLNFDLKKFWGRTHISNRTILDVNAVPLKTKAKINPIVLSGGVSWKM
jgi:outer membrane protein W